MLEEDTLGLKIAIKPTLHRVDMFCNKGILPFLLLIRWGTLPTSTVVRLPILLRSGQGTKANETMFFGVCSFRGTQC